MTESFGANPAEVRPTVQLQVSDTLEDIDSFPNEEEPALRPRREGLPPSFRMRHDKHYVEELMSTSTITSDAASVTNARPMGPGTPDAPSSPSAAAMELIAGRLEFVVAHSTAPRGAAPSADLVSRAVEVELQRVSRFARAVAISARRIEPARRSVTAGEIAAAIRSACARIARLNGMECVITTDDAGFAIAVERALVVQSIVGTVDALFDLVNLGVPDDGLDDRAPITLSLQTARVRPALIVDMACPALRWLGAPERFFENNAQDFALAPAAGILLASAAHGVRLHGGRVEMRASDGGSLRYVIPGEPLRPTAAS